MRRYRKREAKHSAAPAAFRILTFYAALLIRTSLTPKPTIRVSAGWVVMCPVHHASLRVPLVLAIEVDSVVHSDAIDSRSEVDIMGDQQRLPGGQAQNKSLVSRTVVVVGQNPNHGAGTPNLFADVGPRELVGLGEWRNDSRRPRGRLANRGYVIHSNRLVDCSRGRRRVRAASAIEKVEANESENA